MNKPMKIVLALAVIFTASGYLLDEYGNVFGEVFIGFSILLWIFFLLLIYQQRTKSKTDTFN